MQYGCIKKGRSAPPFVRRAGWKPACPAVMAAARRTASACSVVKLHDRSAPRRGECKYIRQKRYFMNIYSCSPLTLCIISGRVCSINERDTLPHPESPCGDGNTERMDRPMKKMISMLLALVMALSLVACGAQPTTNDNDNTASGGDSAAEPANALEKIKADGVLTVALSPDFSPMEFVDSSKTGQDQYVGFDVTLAKYIAENLGVELVIEPMSFDASQTAVYTGTVPMSISGYSWTEERAANYELSDYYYAGDNETRQALLIRKDDADKYSSPEALAGQDVGAQNASLQMQLVTEQLSGANPVAIGDITVGVMELKSGNIEALAVAYGNAEMIVDANPELTICTWEFDVKAEYSANVIMMGKGETELLDAVNALLAQAKENNLYDGWYKDAVELGKSENAQELTLG